MNLRWAGGALAAVTAANLVAVATIHTRPHAVPATAVVAASAPLSIVTTAPPTSISVLPPTTTPSAVPVATTTAPTRPTTLRTAPATAAAPTTTTIVTTTSTTTAATASTTPPTLPPHTTPVVTQPIATASTSCAVAPATMAPPVAWLPADLIVPAGTTLVSDESTPTQDRVEFSVPVSLHDFVCLSLNQWPNNGWRLGRGDAEAGEAEDSFAGTEGSGAFRATTDCCDPNKIGVLIVFQPA